MTATQAETLRDQRMARAIDREVAPIWHDRFARLIWRNLPPATSLALDVHCGPGRTTVELLERTSSDAKVVALEPNAALRGLAKARVPAEWRTRVYLKPGDLGEVAGMADDTYDLVVANLVLGEAHNMRGALQGLLRVTKPGGTILATLPMEGTWVEAEDLLREVLRDAGQQAAVRRLRRLANLRPSGRGIAALVADLGIGPHHFVLEQERFDLLFRSGREFLFSPLVEFGPLRLWKAIIGEHDKPQEIFWRLKESIDTYYARRPFAVGVVAGLLSIRVPAEGALGAHAAAETAGEYWRRYPELDALWQARERGTPLTAGSAAPASTDEDVDIDIELDLEGDGDADTDGDRAPHDEPKERPAARDGARTAAAVSAEDEAIFALLENQPGAPPDAELDALLDQVLEFAGGEPEQLEELDEDEVEEIDPDPKRPGETLTRIRALLPPPPAIPPPPLASRLRRKGPK